MMHRADINIFPARRKSLSCPVAEVIPVPLVEVILALSAEKIGVFATSALYPPLFGSDFEFCYFSDNGSSLCISGPKFDSSISVILANVLVDQNSNSATSVILETLNGPQSEPFGDSRSKWCLMDEYANSAICDSN
ncbi:hypothetical protein CEXT_620261 [Caerostris extrusa]|uniref:Uncharacterized protein n=1 Tax=Caerostris extrusa TaxID=172846 RepID=A0AAV4WWU3_CAEEX|nr:hypothetical protein CEXT_620261 [Caerostris extrusa]